MDWWNEPLKKWAFNFRCQYCRDSEWPPSWCDQKYLPPPHASIFSPKARWNIACTMYVHFHRAEYMILRQNIVSVPKPIYKPVGEPQQSHKKRKLYGPAECMGEGQGQPLGLTVSSLWFFCTLFLHTFRILDEFMFFCFKRKKIGWIPGRTQPSPQEKHGCQPCCKISFNFKMRLFINWTMTILALLLLTQYRAILAQNGFPVWAINTFSTTANLGCSLLFVSHKTKILKALES